MELSKLDKRKKQKREWYESNREKVLEQQKNSENKKTSQREWYVNNKARVMENLNDGINSIREHVNLLLIDIRKENGVRNGPQP